MLIMKKYILVPGKGPQQGLDNTKKSAGANLLLILLSKERNFVSVSIIMQVIVFYTLTI